MSLDLDELWQLLEAKAQGMDDKGMGHKKILKNSMLHVDGVRPDVI